MENVGIDVQGSSDSVTYIGFSLLLDEKVGMRFYFRTKDATILQDPRLVPDGNMYYIEVDSLGLAELNETVTVSLGGITVETCPLDYLKMVFEEYADKGDLVRLCRAIYDCFTTVRVYTGL